jgi:hypothetical protein
MKTQIALFSLMAGTAITQAAPPQTVVNNPPAPQPPPPLLVQPGQPVATQTVYVYEQKPITGLPQLVTPQQAQSIVEKFKEGYPKMGNPRMLIYVNRELVDEKSGLKVVSRDEHVERSTTKVDGDKSSTTTQNAKGDYAYRAGTKVEPTLADRQTVRDVERLLGRPLRLAGASLTDQRVATQLMTDKPISGTLLRGDSEQARKDREAVAKLADVVVEVLISSRQVVVSEVSGDKAYNVPDIQVTAIRLSDSRIVGQASAADLLGKDTGRLARQFDVREITEGVALALMEDMMTGVK